MEQNNYNNIQQQPQYQQQPYNMNQPPVQQPYYGGQPPMQQPYNVNQPPVQHPYYQPQQQYVPVYYPEYQYVPVGKPSIMDRWFNFVSRRKHVLSKIFWHITLTPVVAILISLPWIFKGFVWIFCFCLGLCFLSSR